MAWYKCSGGGEGIPLITKSGSIVEYEDSIGGVPVNDLVAEITPIQASGTPSPTNPLPISGYTSGIIARTEKNLFNPSTAFSNKGLYYIADDIFPNTLLNMSLIDRDTSIDMSGVYFGFVSHDYVSGTLPASEFRWVIGNGAIQATKTNKSATDKILTGLACYPKNQETLNKVLSRYYVQVELGSSATAYEPYNGQTESRSFGQTVYGGTWKASQGKVVPWTRLVVDSTNASIIKSSSTNRWYIRPQDCGAVITGVDNTLIACDKMKQGTGIREDDRVFINDSGAIRFNTATAYESASALVTGFGGEITFIFEANTPTEITVEPVLMETIEGENNVFANTGNLTAKFYKSTVSNLDTLVEQTKDLAPDLLALASAGNGTSTREAFDMTDETTGTKATRIPDYIFYKNLNVEKINLSTVESVGSNTFYMCPYLKEINLPNATELKSSAFNASSRSLTSPTPMVINLPSCTNIADSALREMGYAGTPCTITLTACETLQGNAIRGASARYFTIDTLDLPAVKTIGQESFNYHQFTNVIIGTACTSIASKPFNYCTITNLTVKATTPPTLNANGLGCTPTHIYVPADSVATYKAASNWSTYASIIEAIPT